MSTTAFSIFLSAISLYFLTNFFLRNGKFLKSFIDIRKNFTPALWQGFLLKFTNKLNLFAHRQFFYQVFHLVWTQLQRYLARHKKHLLIKKDYNIQLQRQYSIQLLLSQDYSRLTFSSSSSPVIKALIFDLDDTLYHSESLNQAYRRARTTLVANHFNISPGEAQRLFINTKAVLPFEKKKRPGHQVTASETMEVLGIKIKSWEEWKNARVFPSNYLKKDVRLQNMMRRLGEREYKRALLTNNNRYQVVRILQALGISGYFVPESIFCQPELEFRKPDPRVFIFVATQIGVTPQKCISIGDRRHIDIEPAESIGMRGIHIASGKDLYNLEEMIDEIGRDIRKEIGTDTIKYTTDTDSIKQSSSPIRKSEEDYHYLLASQHYSLKNLQQRLEKALSIKDKATRSSSPAVLAYSVERIAHSQNLHTNRYLLSVDGISSSPMGEAGESLRRVVEGIARPLIDEYQRWSEAGRRGLNKEITSEQAFRQKILPRLKARYSRNLKKGIPTLVAVSGTGSSAKTTTSKRYIQKLSAELGVEVGEITFDDYILPEGRRPLDPLTGKETEKATEKFEVGRFVEDMMRLKQGETIYKPIFDSLTRGRVTIGIDENKDVVVRNGALVVLLEVFLAHEGKSKPVISFKGEQDTRHLLGKVEVSTRVDGFGQVIIDIAGTEHIISEEKRGVITITVGKIKTELKAGEEMDALQMIVPHKEDIYLVEGILTLYDKRLNREYDDTIFFDADFDVRLERMLKRFESEVGRKITREEFIPKRLTLRLTEEIPFVLPSRKDARVVINTQARFESIFVLYKQEKLALPEFKPYLEEAGIEARELIPALRDSCIETVKARLREGRFIGHTRGTAFKVFFDEGGLVVKVALDRSSFDYSLVPLFETVLKKRLGGLLVPGLILDASELKIE
ncbi:MAG: HAD hydrolase-like protein, partial [Candidatus Omnitrophica bacterium]|nr:HAD hydrolase-like protein [Candidatus Omnitrophota bacterium]